MKKTLLLILLMCVFSFSCKKDSKETPIEIPKVINWKETRAAIEKQVAIDLKNVKALLPLALKDVSKTSSINLKLLIIISK